MIAAYAGITTVGLYIYYLNCRKIKREEIEMRSSRHALMPLLFAERDREYLKQLKRNRDEENDLMRNVPGWETGTWFGEKIFKTLPEDTLVDPIFKEYYAHAPYKAYAERANIKLYS